LHAILQYAAVSLLEPMGGRFRQLVYWKNGFMGLADPQVNPAFGNTDLSNLNPCHFVSYADIVIFFNDTA
jgi:hypothetical protein